MFTAPPRITAEVFARIPEHYSSAAEPSDWSALQIGGRPVANFLEGPAFDSAGNLWVVDIPWGRLFRIAPDGEVSLGGEYDGWPNGMKFLTDGTALIADHRRGIMRFDPASGAVTALHEQWQGASFKGCNDLCIAKNGDVWFTDQGQTGWHDPTGRLFRMTPSGELECLLDCIPSPNGLVLNRAETILYLAVTRANAIWRVPLHPDGRIGKVGTFIQMSGGTGPDGVAIDEGDGLAVCHVGLGAVWLFNPQGEPVLRIDSPDGRHTTNCAFGGPDRKTLFITESDTGTVLTAPVPVAGRALL